MGHGASETRAKRPDMNMLVDDEWTRQFHLKNYGTFQEKIDAAEWLREYAFKHIHDHDLEKDER